MSVNIGTERTPLSELSQEQIVRTIDLVNSEKRTTIIPIGFPQAGKSMFLSSLMHYCEEYHNKQWVKEEPEEKGSPYMRGAISKGLMVNFFRNKTGIPSTPQGTIDLIGLTINPIKKRPKLDLAFIDLAGDDLEDFFDPYKSSAFEIKIKGILSGLETGNPIFCMITPYQPLKGDAREDDLHAWFINYIKQNMPNLFRVAKFIIVASHWDKVHDKRMTVEKYIETHRPKLNTLIRHREFKVYYIDYSVGLVRDFQNDSGEQAVVISRVDFDYPHRFWNKLYEFVTGKSLEGSVWYKKIIGG